MNLIKSIFFILISYIYSYNLSFWDFNQSDIYSTVWWTGTIIDSVWPVWGNWLSLLDWILLYFKNSVFNLLALLVIAVFIYIWWKLVVARWKPDEFKKALMNFVYVIVWIFLVSAAWAIVKVVTWLNF